MASTSETGNARNISNFQSLINSCTGFGAPYQPSEIRLKLPALNTQHTACAAAQSAVVAPLADYNKTVSERKALYEPLDGLVTRALSMFDVTQALPQVKDFAKTIADKIRGMNRKKKTTPESPDDETHSTSQRSFVMMADNFGTFIGILAAEPTYTPAETDLQVTSLQTLLAQMQTKNNLTDLAYLALKAVRTDRNKLLYGTGTGLVDIALDVKKYVKAAFGVKSSQYNEIKGLKFVRMAKDPG